MTPSSKKTEKLEIRLSPEEKASFRRLCRAQNDSASQVVRSLIIARWVETLAFKDLPTTQRAMIAACGVLAGGLSAVSLTAAAAALHNDMRLGLAVFLIVQTAIYAAIATSAFRLKWRLLGSLLLGQVLLQAVYGAEVTPPAPAVNTLSGLVFGMLSPTIVLALAAAVAWSAFRQGVSTTSPSMKIPAS